MLRNLDLSYTKMSNEAVQTLAACYHGTITLYTLAVNVYTFSKKQIVGLNLVCILIIRSSRAYLNHLAIFPRKLLANDTLENN